MTHILILSIVLLLVGSAATLAQFPNASEQKENGANQLVAQTVQAKAPFVVGDVVPLRSGGRTMTVTEVGDAIKVTWHEAKEDVFRSMSLPPAALVLAEPPKR